MLGVDLYTYFLHIHAHDIKPRFPDKSSHVTCTLGRPPNRGDPTGGYGRHFRPAKVQLGMGDPQNWVNYTVSN